MYGKHTPIPIGHCQTQAEGPQKTHTSVKRVAAMCLSSRLRGVNSRRRISTAALRSQTMQSGTPVWMVRSTAPPLSSDGPKCAPAPLSSYIAVRRAEDAGLDLSSPGAVRHCDRIGRRRARAGSGLARTDARAPGCMGCGALAHLHARPGRGSRLGSCAPGTGNGFKRRPSSRGALLYALTMQLR